MLAAVHRVERAVTDNVLAYVGKTLNANMVTGLETSGLDSGLEATYDTLNTEAEDWALFTAVWQSVGVALVCFVVFMLMRLSPTLMRQSMAPVSESIAGKPSGAASYPGTFGVIAELRHCLALVRDPNAVGLEKTLIIRYIAHNLRLLCYAAVSSVLLIPLYAVEPGAETNWIEWSVNCTDVRMNGTLPEGCVTWWSFLERMTISHVPTDSWRLAFPGLFILCFAAAHVYELGQEWRWYAEAKHEVLKREAVEHVAALISVEASGDAAVDHNLLVAEMSRIVGAEQIVSIATVEELRAGETGVNPLEQVLTSSLSTVGKVAGKVVAPVISPVGEVVSTVTSPVSETIGATQCCDRLQSTALFLVCGDHNPNLSRFLILFRSRRAATLCLSASAYPSIIISKPTVLHLERAPSPEDIYWPNLLRPRWRLWANFLGGLGLTIALYLFWTVPVAAVQGLASIQSLSQADWLDWLTDWVKSMGAEAIAQFQGFMAALVLQIFLFVTLWSGLFQWLVRLSGAWSQTLICSRAAGRMMLFQLIFILLISTIASTLWDSLENILENPTEIPSLLAGALPGQSTFYMHYILNGILVGAALEAIQLNPLWMFWVRWIWHQCTHRGVLDETGAKPPMPPPAAQTAAYRWQRIAMTYATVVLQSGIFLMYMMVAPVSIFLSLLYFSFAYLLYAYLLTNVDGHPAVDTAGACWEQAVRYETWSLLVAEILLFGILTLRDSTVGAVFAALAVAYTMFFTNALRHRYEPLANQLSAQAAVALDDAGAHSKSPVAAFDSLAPYAKSCVDAEEVDGDEPSTKKAS